MERKLLKFRGLDLRTNTLERDGNTARNCDKVRLNDEGDLIKAEEFAGLSIPYDLTSTPANWDDELPTGSSIIDFVEFEGDFILLVKTEPLTSSLTDFTVSMYKYSVSGGTLEVVPFQNYSENFAEVGWGNWYSRSFDGKITHFEKNGCLYFISESNSQTAISGDMDGNPLMMKYDGLVWYAAGVPEFDSGVTNAADEGTLSGGATGDDYVRYLPMYVDNQGNQIFGEWRVQKDTAVANVLTKSMNSLIGANQYNYHSVYVSCDDVSGDTITESNLDMQGTVNGPIGSHVFALDASNDLYRLTIASESGGVVTFENPMRYTGTSWSSASSFSLPISFNHTFSSFLVMAYWSIDYSSGFVFGDVKVMNEQGSISFDTSVTNDTPDWANFTQNFEDFYSTEIKGNPPAGIQVREYGTSCLLLDSNTLYFSDIGLGGSVENFTAFDNILVGDEEYGDKKAFFSNQTFIAIFRETESYVVTGNIYTGNYTVRSYRTTGRGGQAPAGIGNLNGQCIFASNVTIEAALENGEIQPIGDRIEALFADDVLSLGLDLSTADYALDPIRKLIFMFVEGSYTYNSQMLVYDYEKDEWFKSGYDCSGGLLFNPNDNKMYYCDGEDIYQEQSSYSSGVLGYWYSNFETMGVPSLKKRFQRISLFDSYYACGNIQISAYKDWSTGSSFSSTQTIDENGSSPVLSRRLSPERLFSIGFNIQSTGTNVLRLNGFEYDFSIEQSESNKDGR